MYEIPVSGEIKTIAVREGSSGIFTGTIAGLYQGYRFGSSAPDLRDHVLELPNGTIALRVQQQIVTPLPPRLPVHPFANGNDPFEDPAPLFAALRARGGGPPPGVHNGAGSERREAPGMENGKEIFKRVHYMEVKLEVDPDRSSGIFAGATGEIELAAPRYRMAGYTVVESEHGDLYLEFLEAGTRELLRADLRVDGERSTGLWRGARGELEFALEVTPPFFGRGPYSGTIWTEQKPPTALGSKARKPRPQRAARATVNGVELEYEVRGEGEPVLLIHGGLLADENTPLLHEPALTERHQVINYHRRGFAGSSKPDGRASIADQAADALALLRELGVERAHVVGHSLGGTIALQLALDAPEATHSLALMEPAIMAAIAKAEAQSRPDAVQSQQQFIDGMRKVSEIYASGDTRGALLAFLETRAGDAFRGVLDWLTTTGEFDQAVRDADTFLRVEMPAAYAWTLTRDDATRIAQPVASILGAHSPERAQRVHRVLKSWVPQAEDVVLADAEHALPLMDPPGVAQVLADFFARHPIGARA